jgi:hypothetical protein
MKLRSKQKTTGVRKQRIELIIRSPEEAANDANIDKIAERRKLQVKPFILYAKHAANDANIEKIDFYSS